MEATERNAKALKGSKAAVHKMNTPRGPATQRPPTWAPCYRCGRTNHDPKDCRHRKSVCHFCNKGHIAPVCRGRQSKNGHKPMQKTFQGKRQPSQQTSYVATDGGKSETELPLFMVGNSASKPLYTNVLVNGKDLVMEIDTGAAVSIISETQCKQLFPNVKLDKSSIQLRTYTGEKLPVLGQINVSAQYEDQMKSLDLVVVTGNGPTLLGRNWLLQLRLDWAAIRRVEPKTQPLGLEPLLAVKAICRRAGHDLAIQGQTMSATRSSPEILQASIGPIRHQASCGR